MFEIASGVLPDAKFHRPNAEYVRALLERANISQRGFARIVGINERTMRDYALGEREMPYTMQFCLESLARAGMVRDAAAPMHWLKREQRALVEGDRERLVLARRIDGDYVLGRVKYDAFGAVIQSLPGVGVDGGSVSANAITEYAFVS